MKITSFKIGEDLKARADEWCEKNDRSFGYLVRLALTNFLNSINL